MTYFSKLSKYQVEIPDEQVEELQGLVRGGKLNALYQIMERERIDASQRVMEISEPMERVRFQQGRLYMWKVLIEELKYVGGEGFDRMKKEMEERLEELQETEEYNELDEGEVNYANMV